MTIDEIIHPSSHGDIPKTKYNKNEFRVLGILRAICRKMQIHKQDNETGLITRQLSLKYILQRMQILFHDIIIAVMTLSLL